MSDQIVVFGDGDRDAVGVHSEGVGAGTGRKWNLTGDANQRMESSRASAMAVTVLVAPGPLQLQQTAGLPSVRAIPERCFPRLCS